jgi:phosphoserine phosphatase
MIYIFDLDSTLANLNHRLHFIQSKPADWTSFYQACDQDKPIPEIIEINRALNSEGNYIAIFSGRSDECREKTIRWLGRENVLYDVLLMRKQGDYRQDYIVKAEMLDQFVLDPKWRPLVNSEKIGGVFEDRKQVVDMFRARGLRVFQVAEGEF